MRWLDGITDSVDINFSKLWEMEKDRKASHAWVPKKYMGHKKLDMTEQLK